MTPPTPKHFLPLTIFLLLIMIAFARGESAWDSFSDSQIVEAIGKAENSVKYPYGIKSIDTKGNKDYARQICLQSVRNGRKRWIQAGRPYDLIIHMGLRYSPPATNPNWVRLVKYFLAKGRGR